MNIFSLTQLKELARSEAGNLVVSPPSVSTGLAMLQQGARGRTHLELEKALNLYSFHARRVYGGLAKHLQANMGGPDKTLIVANKIFLQNGFTLLPEFSTIMATDFSTEVGRVDFRKEHSLQPICQWMSYITENSITRVFDQDPPKDTDVVLASVIFYKSTWENRFNKKHTKLREFEVSPGKRVTVHTMYHPSMPVRYGSNPKLKAKWAMIPFESDRFSMLVIRPDRRFGLSELIHEMSDKDLYDIFLCSDESQVEISLPRIKTTSMLWLNEALAKLGVSSAFSQQSDFTGMTKESLRTSKFIQKAALEIDEAGGIGASSTGAQLRRDDKKVAEISFLVDRPFLAAIVETKLGLPLLFAVVRDPSDDGSHGNEAGSEGDASCC
ncbi:serpin B6-like [Bacillus rossius redtenbacheri]|uniref:serpin B6-like n=1 Tax=Bacillus rossius redtenbacheri TaxID=93214 RepID=UPI002FDF0605